MYSKYKYVNQMSCNRNLKQEVKISLSFPLKVNFAEKNVIYKCIIFEFTYFKGSNVKFIRLKAKFNGIHNIKITIPQSIHYDNSIYTFKVHP